MNIFNSWQTWNPMKIQSFPTVVKPSLVKVFMVKTIRPALVITPMVEAISNILCHVPKNFKCNVEIEVKKD